MTGERIRVDVPESDVRRDRVEREVFDRLAAIRAADRADAVAPRRPWFPRLAIPVACVATLAIVVTLVATRGARFDDTATTPSLVMTPVGGSSRFTVGDAVIDASGDTSVQVQNAEGGVVLVLDRGSIDCDVAPRDGRPPFRVLAGDVAVEVVGTRFAVTRVGAGARVDVTRGKVHVRGPAGERYLGAGETWTPSVITATLDVPRAITPEPEGKVDVEVEPEVLPPPSGSATRREPARSSREAFRAAERLEATDPRQAARGFRAVANGGDSWAALALFSLAQLHAQTDVTATLRELDELARRFPRSANAEDAAWLRVETQQRAGRTAAARAAAAAYLAAFPKGTYATRAARLATP